MVRARLPAAEQVANYRIGRIYALYLCLSVVFCSPALAQQGWNGGSNSGGGGSLTLTDGVHTVTPTTQITVTGGTVGGTTPNATLTVSPGASTVTDGAGNTQTSVTTLSLGNGLSTTTGSSGTAPINLTTLLNTQSGTGAYAIASTDGAKTILRTNSGGGDDTIVQANTAGFTSGFSTTYVTGATAGNTITPTVSTVNGLASLKLGSYQGVQLFSDSTNYHALLGVPQPATQTGLELLAGDMIWTTPPSPTIGKQSNLDGKQVKQGTWSAGTATLTVRDTFTWHYAVGDIVTVSSLTGYNGTFRLEAATSTTVAYSLATNPGTVNATYGLINSEPVIQIQPASPFQSAIIAVANSQCVPLGQDAGIPILGASGGDSNILDYGWYIGCDGHSESTYLGGIQKSFRNGLVDNFTSDHMVGWTSASDGSKNPGTSTNIDAALFRASAGTLEISSSSTAGATGSLLLTGITASGTGVIFSGLTGTTAAGGKNAVCIDGTTHQLYASNAATC